MASQQKTVDYIVDQMGAAGEVSARKMFGEYGIYCDGKIVALVCDDKLFIKPTDGGKKFLKKLTEAPPYPGAKPYFLIAEDMWDEREWLSELIKITTAEVPISKKKKKK